MPTTIQTTNRQPGIRISRLSLYLFFILSALAQATKAQTTGSYPVNVSDNLQRQIDRGANIDSLFQSVVASYKGVTDARPSVWDTIYYFKASFLKPRVENLRKQLGVCEVLKKGTVEKIYIQNRCYLNPMTNKNSPSFGSCWSGFFKAVSDSALQDLAALELVGYHPLPYAVFRAKIKKIFHIDMNQHLDYALDHTSDQDYDEDNRGICRYKLSAYGFIRFPGSDSCLEDAQTLYMLNKLILENDTIAFHWFKKQDALDMTLLVQDAGICTNEQLLDYAIKKTDWTNFETGELDLKYYLFRYKLDEDGGTHFQRFRPDMLAALVRKHVNLMYLPIILRQTELRKECLNAVAAQDCMYRTLADIGMGDSIRTHLSHHPELRLRFKNHGYWGSKNLQALCEASAQSQNPGKEYITRDIDGYTNLRAKPSVSSSALAEISDCAKVQLLGRTGNWYKVSYAGQQGYVYYNRIKEY